LVFASHVKVRSNQVLSFALSWASLNSRNYLVWFKSLSVAEVG
jgi:hypothetical protein